ncbi:sulfotransferase [Mycolicibacterium sp. PAM1]|uniref:sulfotransferase n=1 Tax=Mycolicibacterium sp. PAM1 TaxID=2853535 RepID=UPI001C3D15A2|nr:sulfotransferase [Mycolicibacterium sp. PAM1]
MARQQDLVEAVAQVAGATAVLDSNKEYSRAIMLLRMQPEARIIHLHRSPVTTLGSRHHRVKEAGTGFRFLKRTYYYRVDKKFDTPASSVERKYAPEWSYPLVLMLTASAWSVGMVLGLLIKARYPRRVLSVRYENLMADPLSELARIGSFLQIDIDGVQAMVTAREPFPIGHILGGNNQLRRNTTVAFDPSVRNRRKMPNQASRLALPFAAPGNLLRGMFAR